MSVATRIDTTYLQQQINDLLARVSVLESQLEDANTSLSETQGELDAFKGLFPSEAPGCWPTFAGDAIESEVFVEGVTKGVISMGVLEDEDAYSYQTLHNEESVAVTDDIGNVILGLVA